MKKIIKLRESDLNRIVKRVIEEQVKATLTPSNQPSNLQPTTNVQSRTINPTKGSGPVDHDLNAIFAFGLAFVPVVGPFLSAGIALADALSYANEGKKGEAGVTAFFALLPGIGSVVAKIPGVKQLGQKGMEALASKVITNAPLSAVEQGVVSGINLNKELVKQETNNFVKNMASKVVTKVEDPAIQKKLLGLSKDGIQVKAENTAMDMFKTPTKPGFFNAVTSSLSKTKSPKRT
jgi:hypothetical protein